MNKKDFWTLVACNLVTFAILIEHLCGLELAIWCMCAWGIISAIIHINILRDYVQLRITTEED